MTEKLRALALAASPGPWHLFCVYADCEVWTQRCSLVAVVKHEQTAKFIAEANPTTILALLDEIDKLKADNAGLRKDAERLISSLDKLDEGCTGPGFRGWHNGNGVVCGDEVQDAREALALTINAAKGDSHE
jgi:hypothetical protein